jgi:hypothetical protein
MIYCKNCGRQIVDNSKFCSGCGVLQHSNPKTIGIQEAKNSNPIKKLDLIKDRLQPIAIIILLINLLFFFISFFSRSQILNAGWHGSVYIYSDDTEFWLRNNVKYSIRFLTYLSALTLITLCFQIYFVLKKNIVKTLFSGSIFLIIFIIMQLVNGNRDLEVPEWGTCILPNWFGILIFMSPLIFHITYLITTNHKSSGDIFLIFLLFLIANIVLAVSLPFLLFQSDSMGLGTLFNIFFVIVSHILIVLSYIVYAQIERRSL